MLVLPLFVSRGRGGRTSDKYITAKSVDFIAALEEGMRSWQTGGFDISDVLGDLRVKVTIPNFKGQGRSQLKEGEGKRSDKISRS